MSNYTTIVSIPKILVQQINEAIAAGFFIIKADFLKQSIRNKLEHQTLLNQRRKKQDEVTSL